MAIKWIILSAVVMAAAVLLLMLRVNANSEPEPGAEPGAAVKLPEPKREGEVSLERALAERRSVRSYRKTPLSLAEAGQLLWAAQGIRAPGGSRTAPSAGALYPLEVYLVAARVEGLAPGSYRYAPERHDLTMVASGNRIEELAAAALGQECVRDAAAVIVFGAVYQRTMGRYGDRGRRYVHMEAGHAAQNVCLQATALGLGSVPVGAFRDEEVKRVTGMSGQEEAVYMVPAGPVS